MEDNSYIGSVLAAVIYIVVGIRLFRLGARTGQLPERLLSLCFLAWGISYLLYAAPHAFADESMLSWCFFSGRVFSDIGAIACAAFTWKVFRGRQVWSPLLVAAIALTLAAHALGIAWTREWEGSSPLSGPLYWLGWIGAVVPCLWIGVEGSIQYRKAGQRQRLGLSDGLVRNRYLLWSMVGAVWVALECIFVVQDATWQTTQASPASLDAVVGVLEVLSLATVWLVFFPPRFYRQLFAGDSPSESVGEA